MLVFAIFDDFLCANHIGLKIYRHLDPILSKMPKNKTMVRTSDVRRSGLPALELRLPKLSEAPKKIGLWMGRLKLVTGCFDGIGVATSTACLIAQRTVFKTIFLILGVSVRTKHVRQTVNR